METKHSTAITMVKGIFTGSLIAVLMIASMLLLQGCHFSFSSFGSNNISNDGLMQALDGELDKEDIEFLGYRTDADKEQGEITKYSFVMTYASAGVSDDLLTIYETANEVFKTEEFDDRKISIIIYSHHGQNGVYSSVVTFKNYDEDGRTCDYICEIYVNGIDNMTDGYNSGLDYDVNSKEYWSQFDGKASISYSDNFTEQNEDEAS